MKCVKCDVCGSALYGLICVSCVTSRSAQETADNRASLARKNGDEPSGIGEVSTLDRGTVGYVGLTKREHFAALAMQGILAGRNGERGDGATATWAVEAADALLLALEGGK